MESTLLSDDQAARYNLNAVHFLMQEETQSRCTNTGCYRCHLVLPIIPATGSLGLACCIEYVSRGGQLKQYSMRAWQQACQEAA